MTTGEDRRVGKYHHGIKTVVVGVRMPATMRDKLKEQAENAGRTISEHIEWLMETQALRTR